MKEKIQQLVKEVLAKLSIEADSISLDYPEDPAHGDYSTNIALASAKKLKANPVELAKKIVHELNLEKPAFIEKVAIAGPGFINFYLSPEFFRHSVADIISRGTHFGKTKALEGEKIMIEYTDPNPFKQFHAGHVMSNVIGESLARIHEWNGATVLRACYQGDVGLHIAKIIWAMKSKKLPEGSLSEKSEFMGKAYVEGSKAYDENPEAMAEIKEINRKIFERSDPDINRLYEWGRATSLEHFETLYAILGTKFDHYFFESEMAPIGMFVVEELVAKGILVKSEGAIVFKGEEYGLHTRVFVNKEGLPTYETKELGLNKRKFDLADLDRSIIITANEQNDYFKVLIKVMQFAYPPIANKIRHISHGMLRFASGKMSSRTGNIVTGEALIEQVEAMVLEKVKDREMSMGEKKRVAEEVGIAAIKYSILRQATGKDIIFDIEKSLSFEGDSGPYLQYSATRAGSILHKAEKEGIAGDSAERPVAVFPFEKKLHRFPEIIERSEKELAPQHIATYLIDLAAGFNGFYAEEQIVRTGDEFSPYKIALTSAFRTVMQNGLSVLGIKTPEKM